MIRSFKTFVFTLLFVTFLLPSLQAQEVQKPSTDTYEKGIQLFDSGLYIEAASELRQFIASHNDHELALSAAFYRTRALAREDSVNRISYYRRFISKHPHTDFAPKLLFDLAKRAEDKDEYTEAIKYYSRALDLGLQKKQAGKTYYWMAEAELANDNNRQAEEYFQKVADDYSGTSWAPKALYARGRLHLRNEEFDSASETFEQLKRQYPNDDITRRTAMALGESYYQQERYEEAITAFKDAMPYLDDEMKTKAVLLVAESYNALGNFDKASATYLRYIKETKGTPEERAAHYGLGWLYNKQEIYHWAADEFEKAAEGTDEIARKAYYYKAVNEKLGSNYQEALNTFRNFGDKFSEGPWVEQTYYEWAMTDFEVGNYSEAIEVLLPLARKGDSLDWGGKIYTLLGNAYYANKEYTRSIEAYEAAGEVADVEPSVKREARFQKAWVQYSNQAYDEAQKIFQSLNKEVPDAEVGIESLFWSADSYYHMEDYGPSASQFAQFIQQYPDHELVGPASYSLGWSYFKMGKYEEAIGPLKTFLQKYDAPEQALYPYETDTRLRIGDAYYALGSYGEAISMYQKVLGADPGGDYALFQVANSYYRSDRTYDAVTTFRKFLNTYPNSSLSQQTQYNIAYIYLNTGNYSQAVEEFETVIEKYPQTEWAARAQFSIGDTYYNSGDYDKAIDAYKEVINKYPDSDYIIEAANGIQYAQLTSGDKDQSSDILEDFVENNPDASMADRLRYRQADNMMKAGDYEGAIDEFQHYLDITNDEEMVPDAHFNMAKAYEQTDQLDKAREEYQNIADQFPDSDQAVASLSALARMASTQGDSQQAYDYYSKMLEQGGRKYQLEAYIGMGNAKIAMNNISEAEKQYREALKIDGDYAPANVGLAKVSLKNGDYQDAKDILSLVAEANTTETGAEAQYLIGVAGQQQGDCEQALEHYSKVKVLYGAFDTWVAKSMLGKAKCFIELDKPGEARKMLQSVQRDYPDLPQAEEAKKLMDTAN